MAEPTVDIDKVISWLIDHPEEHKLPLTKLYPALLAAFPGIVDADAVRAYGVVKEFLEARLVHVLATVPPKGPNHQGDGN